MEMMEAPISASQGAMRSLPRKLESLLSGPKQGLRAEEKKKLRGLQADLQGLIDSYLFEPSEVESPASTASFWMKDVRDLSYDIDDFIYELAHVAVSGARIGAAQIQKPNGVKISRFPDKLKRRQWISDEISGFRTRVKEAIQRHKAYLGGCRWRPSSSSDQHSAPSPCGRAAIRLVGMDTPVKQLCGWLANDAQPEHKVASIVGTSGVGKTTLAREVYRKLGGQFQCRAFVQTSRKQDMRILLTSILSQVRRRHLPDSFEVHKLLFEIKEHLQDKTYIIVIDNLWASSTWDIISHALPKGNCCSRILTTTEVDAIAQTCCADTSKYVFKKEPLSEDESRELFLGTVFGHEAGCPQVLKEVSNVIIKRSGGLPLAIITLASLLAGQPASSIEHWNYIKNSLSSDSSTNTSLEGIKQVLNLGYDNLPHGLKACMLYLCLYEEDRVIWKEDLVKQWMAEGFICAVEVAQSYFVELVSRGMIQPVDINCNDEILSCRVHHMVLHFIRYKSTEENFSIALDHSQTTIRLADKVRRLALHFGNVEYATLPMTASMRLSQVRSLAFSGLLKCMPSIVEFRFIQVLILKLWADPDNRSDNLTGSDDLNGNITEPDDLSCNLSEISELFRLRYFHLDACHMSVELPTQMKRLKDLVAWEIDADVSAVPSDIVDLPGLFFLSIPSEAHLPTDIGRMTSLRTLGVIDLSKNSTENIMCLGELTNLQDLRLTCSTLQPDNLEKNLECLGLIVQKLSNLKCVTLVPAVSSHVKTQDDVGAPNMSISWDFTIVPLSPALLQRLELSWRCCIFSSLPEWTKDLTKLVILKMAVRKVSGEDVVILKGLPSLTALSLFVWTAPIRRIIFDNEGFFVLKYFKFVCAVPCLSFLDGAMPKVRNLKLDFNANRMEQYILVAAGFERLIGLKKISIKIGGAGADECDRRSAQLVLTDAISKHPNTPIISVQWVNWKFCGDDEKSIEAQKEVWNQILGEQDVNAGESNSYLQNTVYIGMEVVSGAIGSLIPKLGMLLMEEYNLHKRVKKDVEFLRKELESMHAALIKVGEVPRDQLDRQVKLWADEVRDLSYNMEDVVDNFLIHVDDIQQPHNNSGIFKELKNKMIGLFKKGKNHHRIADAIEEIKEQLLEVSARRDRNKGVILDNPREPIAIDPRLRALYAEATELVGIYGKRDQELMRLLSMEGDDASKNRLKKVSIVGFGGLGKTTLARAVYEKIKGDFDCQAFVPVGQNPDIKKVLRDILIDLGNPHSDLAILDANQLIKKLHEFLENKRYLVIIDDIWDEKLWEGINFAFSNRNNLGSRLITTTRIVSVSNSCCSSNNDSVYQMKPLSVDDSRRLFYKRIFPGESGCPNEFEQVSRDILKKCGGVPLAIITIASALAGGKQVKPKREWDILLQSLGSGLTEDNSLEEMRRILSFSYYNLPSHLKTCLMYLCIYPEDSNIKRDRLIWKWVAEGFVHHGNQGTSLFLLGLNYFNQLINRSMIQPIYDDVGQVYACRVHDMVLDLICNLSHEAKFVNVLDGTGNSMSSQSNVRRLSLQNKNEDHQAKPLTTIMSMSRLRSITIFPLAVSIMPALTRFEVLRVLDLSDCNMGKSSRLQINLKGVGHLIHLRYLGLAGTGISELPAEIGNLQFLEVLDLESNIQLDRLPSTICKLRRLIYLKAYICEVVTGVFQNLTSIEVLTGILVSLNIIAQELGNLVRLRELQIHFKDGSSDLYEGFVKSLCNLRQIESLSIDCNSEETSFELMDLLGERWVPPVHLSEFVSWMPSKLSALRGWIKRDPSHLSNLSELILDSVKEVQQEDVEIIGGLLSLRRLRIRSTHQTQRLLVIRADGFCCMVDFALYCGSAAQIMFEPGALPRAEEVRFSLGVWVAKEDGNCGFNLGLQGNLLSLRRYVIVRIYCGGARVGEAKEAEAAVRLALKAHPNHPLIFIDMRPRIAKGAHDDDLCDYEN